MEFFTELSHAVLGCAKPYCVDSLYLGCCRETCPSFHVSCPGVVGIIRRIGS